MTGRPSERCAAAEALERILQGAGSPWVRQQARAVLASPCCVSAPDQEQVKEALEKISERQPETLAMIRRHGFVFATPVAKPDEERTEAERWEKLAFSIYTDLCEVDSIAESALALFGSEEEER